MTIHVHECPARFGGWCTCTGRPDDPRIKALRAEVAELRRVVDAQHAEIEAWRADARARGAADPPLPKAEAALEAERAALAEEE